MILKLYVIVVPNIKKYLGANIRVEQMLSWYYDSSPHGYSSWDQSKKV